MRARYLVAVLLAFSLAGCSSKHRIDAYEAPSSRLDSHASFYVALPEDGRYGGTVYPGSGEATAHAVSTALLLHVDKVVRGSAAGEDLESALFEAERLNLSYVVHTSILNWEDRATEWSGIPDKITLKLAVYEVGSGQAVSSTIASASSKWGTLGGDHPQDLLTVPIKQFVDLLF